MLIVFLNRENPTDKLTEEIIIGRRLHKNEMPDNISNYVDLTAEFEDPKSIRQTSNYICFPILDASIPCKRSLKRCIEKLKPGITYIHCAQGHGRTGLFTIALLAEKNMIKTYDEGITIIQSARPAVKLNKEQFKFIKTYLKDLKYLIEKYFNFGR